MGIRVCGDCRVHFPNALASPSLISFNTKSTKLDRRVAETTFEPARSAFASSLQTNLGLTLRDVQAQAAKHLLYRRVAEMQTGEGKTLATALAASVLAASGHRVMVATANDYLATRDASWMEPIYRDMGLRSCSVFGDAGAAVAYGADITYGTIRQFGFDFLRSGIAARDHLPTRQSGGKTAHFDVLIVDEADSVLIDEARTPMIITAASHPLSIAAESLFRWSAETAGELSQANDYVNVSALDTIALTESGRHRVLDSQMPPEMKSFSTTEIFHALERALTVRIRLLRDHHYIVRDGRIDLVDEYTGRASAKRSLGRGLHQAIEAKESLLLTPPPTAIARMTVQNFVAKFDHVCGLTATAREDKREMRAVYGLSVASVPTFRPVLRTALPTIVCAGETEKFAAIAAEIDSVASAGRAVLVGTRTVSRSQSLSQALDHAGIPHKCLNANNPEQEAKIIELAGQAGQVTVATNMAGRGTDIPLSGNVRSIGGLHVIVSELHASRRIDLQLMGRGARQGDPGTTRLYVAPDDEILSAAFGNETAAEIGIKYMAGRSDRWLVSQLFRAQEFLSRRHRRGRFALAEYESRLAESMQTLGLDPHFDPLPDSGIA